MHSGRNRTIVGLKFQGTATKISCGQRRNRTIVGLKFLRGLYLYKVEGCRNRTIVGLKLFARSSSVHAKIKVAIAP